MNIRDLNINGNRPDALRSNAAAETNRVENGANAAQSQSASAPAPATGDRVEISPEARAAAGAAAPEDVTFARKALLGIPPLSEDRAADILKRVQEGFYSQPEPLKAIASGLANDLTRANG